MSPLHAIQALAWPDGPSRDLQATPTPRSGEPRTVVGVMGDEVTYRTATRERTVKVGSFNDWRRDTLAEVVNL